MNSHPIEHWHQAEAHFRDQQLPRAHSLFAQLAKLPQWAGPAQLRLAQIASAQGKLREATLHILTAAASGEDDVMVLEAVATTLCQLGELEAFVQLLATPALSRTSDATVALTLGRLASQQALTEHALPLLRHAVQLGLDQPELHYLIGLNLLYQGELDEAGRHFEACLARAPLHAACHRQLARLTKARAGHHHVDRLRRTLSALGAEHVDAPPLHYALFKQLDDLDDTPAAWASLSFGMRLRRGQIHHDMEAERRSFDQLMRMPAPIPTGHSQPSADT
ncbi:MAG: hypothetical protein KDI69_02405, partial [Xanthomonadales bacterium]|nr:hypothetical protein [Xanthomonadales bacterium]